MILFAVPSMASYMHADHVIVNRSHWINDCFRLLAACCLFFCAHSIHAQQVMMNSESFTVTENMQYSESDPQLTLDLFVPREPSEPVPCIIVIQGGGFKSQDGNRFLPFAEYFASHGYAAALISYRGRPKYTYQTTIQDVKSAVRYVRHIASVYPINPDKIGAMGRSAGATLAALLAVTGDDPVNDNKNQEVSCSIQAAVAFAGVFDFIARFSDSSHIDLQPNIQEKIQANGEWIGASFSVHNKHWKNASAINYLDKNDAPILFMHCKDDQTVPWIQSQDMFEKMHDLGIPSDIFYFEKGGHGFELDDKELYLHPMISFFRKQFQSPSS